MYAPFFGLDREPFSIAPDPRFLYLSERHREALAHLLYGLSAGGGFVLLTGEIGAGKTTICRGFLEQVPAHCRVAYIFNPKLTVPELLHTVCQEFGVELPGPAADAGSEPSAKAHVDALNEFLLRGHALGQQAVLVIDEAQGLSVPLLEQLRLLTNLETAERKLLQIILIGQPELRDLLARPELKQLSQRVIARYHLQALSAEETAHYVRHRLAVAGPHAAAPFDATLLRHIHTLSHGVPRRINLLADRALLGAYAQGKHQVDAKTVKQAAVEVFGVEQQPAASSWRRRAAPTSWRGLALAGGTVAAAAVVAFVGWQVWVAVPNAGQLQAQASARDAALVLPAPSAGRVEESVAVTVAAAASATAAGASGPYAPHASYAPHARNAPNVLNVPNATSESSARAATAVPSSASSPFSAGSPSIAASMPVAAASGAFIPQQAANSLARVFLADADAVLTAAHPQVGQAWRELALHWNVSVGEGDPCLAVRQAQLACWRGTGVGLPLLRQLARPGVMVLRDKQGRPVHALLVALDLSHAVLQVGQQQFGLTLAALAQAWRGEFYTLWRTPPAWSEETNTSAQATLRSWALEHGVNGGVGAGTNVGSTVDTTAAPRVPTVTAFAEQLRVYQMAQGLPADGRLGPVTLMHLSRMSGVKEPVLAAVGSR